MKKFYLVVFTIIALTCMAFATSPAQHSTPTTLDVTLDLHPVIAPIGTSGALAPTVLQTTTTTATPWAYATVYDFKGSAWLPVITHKVGDLIAVAGHKNWNLSVDGFAGYNTRSQQAVAGISGDAHFKAAENVDGVLGFGAKLENNQPVGAVFLAGISGTF